MSIFASGRSVVSMPSGNLYGMTNKIYKIAILGCGKVAHLHAKAIQNLPNAKLAAVWSRTYNTAENFARQYHTQGFDNIKQLVEKAGIDMVLVCTPHPFHREPAIEAAMAGAHVLVEKPLAASLNDCDAIIEACKDAGVLLGVISQRRWYAPSMRVKAAITDKKIGKPVLGTMVMHGWRDENYYKSDARRGTWDMEGGGVLVNQAPHQLDLLLWYMGEVQELYGIWKNLNHPYIEVEDTALAILKFKNGGIGNIIVSNSQKPGLWARVHIHGENGASVGVQTDGGAMFIAGSSGIMEPPVNDIWTVPGEENLLSRWKKMDTDFFKQIDPVIFYFERQIENFLTAIGNKKNPLVSGEDGRRTVELFTAIYRSALDNRPVSFPLTPENKR